MNQKKYANQTDEDQFVLTNDAEEYIKYRDIPLCQVCNRLISDIQMFRGTGKQGIWLDKVFFPFIIFEFTCHGSSLKFKTFGGDIAKVEESI
ncbi:MAG: hypothetical protein SH817_08690 [Leptospira sp.]|nr:hypothetical protein [Leptospira sp.]